MYSKVLFIVQAGTKFSIGQKSAYANERLGGETFTVPHPNGYGWYHDEAAIQKHKQALYAGRNIDQTDDCRDRPTERQEWIAGNTGIHLLVDYNQKAPWWTEGDSETNQSCKRGVPFRKIYHFPKTPPLK